MFKNLVQLMDVVIVMEKTKLSMEGLEIPQEDITEDLTKYYEMIYQDVSSRVPVERGYKSVEDYVNILYWMKFVKKMDYLEMEKLTGRFNFYQIYSQNRFCWHYNAETLKQCEEMHQEELVSLQKLQLKAKDAKDEDMPPEYFRERKRYLNGELKESKAVLKRYGHESMECFLKEVFYLSYVEKLTTRELSILYDKTTKTITRLRKKLNCNLSLKEAQALVVQKGRRDYSKAFYTRRRNHVKTVVESGLTGSNQENVCRIMIADELIALVGPDQYEIVVGVSNRNIIAPKEIDIPIMVLNKFSGAIKKFAIEYNGDVWHESRREADKEKEIKLRKLGWEYFALEFHSNAGNTANTNRFIESVNEFCKLLAERILAEER